MTNPATDRARTHPTPANPKRDSESKFQALFESISDGLLIANDNGCYVAANPAACDLLGMKRESIIGRSVEEFADPRRKTEVRSNWRRFIQKGSQRGLFRIYRPDGTSRYVEYIARTHIAPNQHLAVLRDITERNQAERSLRERESRMRQEITERKKAVRELQSAKDAAEAAVHAKSQFVANISHEIRTPINGILGTLELLRQSALSTEQKEYAEIMDDSGKTLMALVNELLDFSRIEAGKLKLEIIDFDLIATIDAVLAMFAQRLLFKRIELVSKIDPGIPYSLRGDPVRLRQVLMNLIGNAVKFTDQGNVTLHISKEKESSSKVVLRFSVADTGPGIQVEQKGLLFQPFSQLDNSAKRLYSGTGLGLAISKQLVENMGGSIGVRSAPRKGSNFWFSLPFASVAGSPRTPTNAKIHTPTKTVPSARLQEPKPPAPPNAASHARVLIVEDNRINRLVIVRQLQQLGYAADTVANGCEAIEALKASPYDVVLMDCQMPIMDGYQATRSIRKEEKGRHTPIIAMTAHAMEEDRKKCLEAGMDDYISKPVELENLRVLIKKHLGSPALVDLARLYTEDMAKQLQELEEAIRQKAAERVKTIAHSALGACVMLKLTEMAEPLRRLEDMGTRRDLSNAEKVLENVRTKFAHTPTRVRRFQREILC